MNDPIANMSVFPLWTVTSSGRGKPCVAEAAYTAASKLARGGGAAGPTEFCWSDPKLHLTSAPRAASLLLPALLHFAWSS